jgi:tetratricopeptide (TPR) repeat protein
VTDDNCIDENDAIALVQGELPASDAARIRDHAESCASCREALAALARMPSIRRLRTSDVAPTDLAAGSSERSGSSTSETNLPVRDPARYIRGEEIARGGMGRIIAATDVELGRRIAIKEQLARTAELERRFEREVQITARLQHPSIIAVQEAGRWPTGELFYTMQHVDGRGLDRAIRDSPPTERIALLPHVTAVADALAYAHSQNVIHRDLKPGNVLVGAFGETIVIDWGLAKRLGEADILDSADGALAIGSPRDGSGDLTAAGHAVGTPCYMSPQQAEGHVVDERGDVYALGAILYHVLGGQMPYAHCQRPDQVRQAVLAGPPVALETLAPEIPADLIAIVAKAMAREPELRYRTAAGLAEDLKRYTAGHLVGAHRYSRWQLVRRWIVRHRGAVVVASIALIALAVASVIGIQRIRTERDAAETERGAAQAQRVQVEQLLDFMLVDLHDSLQPLGKLDLLDQVATRAAAYYKNIPVNLADPAQARKRELVQRNLAEVLLIRGHLDEALAAQRASLDIAKRLAATDPNSEKWQEDLAAIQSGIGETLNAKGDIDGAAAAYQTSLDISEREAAREPTNIGWQEAVANAHLLLADVRCYQRRYDDALAEVRAGLAVAERLAAQEPTKVARQDDVAADQAKLAKVLQLKDDLDGALTAVRASISLAERNVASEPNNVIWQKTLAFGRQLLGDVLLGQGQLDGALESYRVASSIVEPLAARDPTDMATQVIMAKSRVKQAEILQRQHKLTEALASLRSTLAVIEPKLEDVTFVYLSAAAATTHLELGNVLKEQGQLDGALAEYAAIEEVAQRVLRNEPTNVEWRGWQVTSHREIAIVLHKQKRYDDTRHQLELALAIAEKLAAEQPTVASYSDDVKDAKEMLAKCCPAPGTPASPTKP